MGIKQPSDESRLWRHFGFGTEPNFPGNDQPFLGVTETSLRQDTAHETWAPGACSLVLRAVPRNKLGGEVMAVLWVWAGGDESSADPMISNLVGDKKTNETMDVFLVKALLNILYGWNPLKDGPPLPVPGTAWDDAAVAYVADYQSRIMKRKKVDAVVSPVPVGISYHTAWVKKYTIATMVGGSRSVLSVKGESDLVTYLKSNYP